MIFFPGPPIGPNQPSTVRSRRLTSECWLLTYLFTDHRRDLKGPQSLFAAHQREAAAPDSVEKRVDLVRHGVSFFDLDRFRPDIAPPCALPRPPIDLRPLLVVIDGDVGVRLEKTDFSLALEGHPAGGHVGDAAAGKGDARIGDVRLVSQDRDADGF